ncbi:anhydro-N-acetylmuramic acid kinase [Aquirufa sp. ROCK-SH2]
MNPQIEKLYQVAQKESKIILGLMSGTSLDGLDLALCEFSGYGTNTRYQILQHTTVDFPSSIKESIREIFAKETIHFPTLSTLNAQIGRLHAKIILETLASWGVEPELVDAIASHGQTVMHCPMRDRILPHSTLQIGDADHIAHLTGIMCISDFRQKHVAAGGEGAPLAVFGDYFLFSKKDQDRILLNIGGIGNYTYLPGNLNPNEIRVTDTGPGNTLIDAAVRKHFSGFYFDKDANLAKQGVLHQELLNDLLALSFFEESFPKSTGPEYFNLEMVEAIIEEKKYSLTPVDLIRTLTEFSAKSIASAIRSYLPIELSENIELIVSGGGSKNPYLIQRLSEQVSPVKVMESDVLGIPSSAKEALLFAILANETLSDEAVAKDRKLGDTPWLTLGKISFSN